MLKETIVFSCVVVKCANFPFAILDIEKVSVVDKYLIVNQITTLRILVKLIIGALKCKEIFIRRESEPRREILQNIEIVENDRWDFSSDGQIYSITKILTERSNTKEFFILGDHAIEHRKKCEFWSVQVTVVAVMVRSTISVAVVTVCPPGDSSHWAASSTPASRLYIKPGFSATN